MAACTGDIQTVRIPSSFFFFGRTYSLSVAEATGDSTMMRKWKLLFVGGLEYQRPISTATEFSLTRVIVGQKHHHARGLCLENGDTGVEKISYVPRCYGFPFSL
jgi:hypothetical protein